MWQHRKYSSQLEIFRVCFIEANDPKGMSRHRKLPISTMARTAQRHIPVPVGAETDPSVYVSVLLGPDQSRMGKSQRSLQNPVHKEIKK